MEAHKNDNFDALRLLAALSVLVSHQFALTGHPEPDLFGLKLGTIGVLVFFAISGFLVTTSWTRDPHMPRFLARRALRVWPALAVCVIGCIAFVALVLAPPHQALAVLPDIAAYLSPNVVFIWRDGNFFRGNPLHELNGSLWTIPVEVQCYVVLAVLGVVARRRLPWALLLASAVVAVLLLCGVRPADWLGNPFFHLQQGTMLLPAFFLAGALASAWPFLQTGRGQAGAIVLGLACAWTGFAGFAWAAILPTLVLLVGRRSWPVLREAGRGGDLSYGIYLWAWPVQQAGIALLGADAPFPVLLNVTLLVVIALSLASWHLIEKRSLSLKPGTRPDASAATAGVVAPSTT